VKKLIVAAAIIIISFSAYAETAQDIINKLKNIKTYTADFVQTTEIEGFGQDQYSGQMYVKSGDKAIWDYDKPYRQFYLFDKTTMKYYDSDTKQMIIQSMNPAANVFMRLMLNPSDIENDFNVTLRSNQLFLEPKEELGIDTLVFEITGGVIKGIKTKDQSGNNTDIKFENIKIDKSIDPAVFSPEIPENTEIFEYD